MPRHHVTMHFLGSYEEDVEAESYEDAVDWVKETDLTHTDWHFEDIDWIDAAEIDDEGNYISEMEEFEGGA
jgi:hypothetical protein